MLSGLFFMLTLLAYLRYIRGQTWQRMAVVAVCFAFGLMSKPMLVTTPIVLLLLDFGHLIVSRNEACGNSFLRKFHWLFFHLDPARPR